MVDSKLNLSFFKTLVNTIPAEIVVVDTEHKIVFVNDYAQKKYLKTNLEAGMSIFECHNQEKSHQIVKEAFQKLKDGENRVYIYNSRDTGKQVYLIGIRDSNETLIGYYEWFD